MMELLKIAAAFLVSCAAMFALIILAAWLGSLLRWK